MRSTASLRRIFGACYAQARFSQKVFRMARYWWLGLLVCFAIAMVPVSARAYYGYGHPTYYGYTYGYTYGPVFNYDYFAASIFGRGSNDKIHPYRSLGCPVLCIGDYWQDTTRRRPIAIIRANRILIR
jgi:hypothetical protein